MAVCDVCEKEYDGKGETIQLYSSKLTERLISDEKMATAKITTSYSQLKPIEVTVCRRHRWELLVQRLMPGLISFLLLYLPIVFIISRFYRFEGVMLRWLYGVSAVITLGLVVVIVRTITLDSIVATLMNSRSRQNGEKTEYLTMQKYNRLSTAGQNKGILGWISQFRRGVKATTAQSPRKKDTGGEQKARQKPRRKS